MRVLLLATFLVTSSLAGRRAGGGHSYGSHSYPRSPGLSGTGTGAYSYPRSGGLSGNANSYNTHNYNHQHTSARYNYSPKTEVHHHYHYSPPQQISYGSTFHPVYHGTPPVYVYEYRDSGSRFDNLLTGLALYNLGRMSANSHNNNYNSHREYGGTPGEVCLLGISRRTGEYEETRIDCKLMSSFIWDVPNSPGGQRTVPLQTVSSTVTNTTSTVHGSESGNKTTVTVVSVKNETVTEALHQKGPSIKVTADMTCYVIRKSYDRPLKKNVECGLLQEYAQRSLRRNASGRLKPLKTIIISAVAYFLISCLSIK